MGKLTEKIKEIISIVFGGKAAVMPYRRDWGALMILFFLLAGLTVALGAYYFSGLNTANIEAVPKAEVVGGEEKSLDKDNFFNMILEYETKQERFNNLKKHPPRFTDPSA